MIKGQSRYLVAESLNNLWIVLDLEGRERLANACEQIGLRLDPLLKDIKELEFLFCAWHFFIAGRSGREHGL